MVAAAGRYRRIALVLGILVLVIIAPRYVISIGGFSAVAHTGVGFNTVRIYNYELLVVVALLFGWTASRKTFRFSFVPFLSVMFFLALVSWDRSSLVGSGVAHFTFGCLAFTAGRRLGATRLCDNEARLLLRGVVAILVFQLVVGLLALNGMQLPLVGESDNQAVVGRLSGTTAHPNTLGKYVALLAVLALPFSRSPDRHIRRLTWVALSLALIIAALTGGRAVLLGMTVMLVLWTLLYRSSGAAEMPRIIRLGLLAAMAAPFAVATIDRFGEDPEGGSRPILREVFMENIGMFLVWGVGPNTYVESLSRVSPVTAFRQLPVHDATLLSLAEFGVFCWALFWIPIVAIYVRATVTAFSPRVDMSGNGLALVSSFPLLLLLVFTGWGMIAAHVLAMWLAVLGFMTQQGDISTSASVDRDRQVFRGLKHGYARDTSRTFKQPRQPRSPVVPR